MATRSYEFDSFHCFDDIFMVVMVYMYGESSLTGTFPYMRVERTESGLTSSKIKIIQKKRKSGLKKSVWGTHPSNYFILGINYYCNTTRY